MEQPVKTYSDDFEEKPREIENMPELIDEETPAAKAGLKTGDIIMEVNLEDVSTKGSDYVSSKVKGKAGTKVKIKVLRGEEKLEFDVERDNIRVYKN